MMLSKDCILKRISESTLDIRVTHNGRWIDQKCTPDVICAVADVVDSITMKHQKNDTYFTSKDVWYSEYAREYVLEQFNKSDPTLKSSKSEYNKFFQMPLELLSYANILEKDKQGRENAYKVKDRDLLQFIGMSERNTVCFLRIYINEVLKCSGIYNEFNKFLNEQTNESLSKLREFFIDFYHRYTRIKKDYEPKRIFPKVINLIANEQNKKGIIRGKLSKTPITYTDLMYNQKNFRDIYSNKPKDVTRQDWLKEHPIEQSTLVKFKADSAKAKKYVRRFNDKYFDGKSELIDSMAIGCATQMHHIFPQHDYREISGYMENIIALTPSQHFSEAHPNNNTQIIDKSVQELLLKAKAQKIHYVINHPNLEQIYSFDNFAHVLKVGLNIDRPESDYNNFVNAMNEINRYYSTLSANEQ